MLLLRIINFFIESTMSKIAIFLAAASAMTGAQAGMIDLASMMGGANLYTARDFNGHSSDVEGSIVAGGNVTIQNYAVNLNNQKAYGDYAVVAGGDIKLTGGSISNGKTYAGGTTSLQQASQVAGGGTPPLDFAATSQQFKALANTLSGLSATGSVESLWSGAKVTGSGNHTLDIFNVSADMFRNSSHWMLNDLAVGQTLIFNVSGQIGSFNDGGISFEPLSGYNVLFNFFEATEVNVRGVIGSVLAPNATVKADWGVINGNVIVDSWNSTIQVNSNHYFKPVEVPGINLEPDAPDAPAEVPEPGTLALLAAGLCAVVGLRCRRA